MLKVSPVNNEGNQLPAEKPCPWGHDRIKIGFSSPFMREQNVTPRYGASSAGTTAAT
jgi:hypothetical protein